MMFANGDNVTFKDGSSDSGIVVDTGKDENGEYYKVKRNYVEQRDKRLTHWYGSDELAT